MAGPLQVLVRRNRGPLLATYGATAVENVFDLLYPFAIGLAIDDLLGGRNRGLVVFIGVWTLHTAVGLGRQRYDTRVFTRLTTEAATDVVRSHTDGALDPSVAVARVGLVRELVTVLEGDVPRLIAAVFAVVGSLVMLVLYDPGLALVAALLVVPVAVLNRRLARRSQRLHHELNDELEREAHVVAAGEPAAVASHFRLLARRRIALSDADATTWGVLEALTIGLAVLAFVRTTDVTREPGTVFATVSYLFAYTSGFEALPALSQQLANVPRHQPPPGPGRRWPVVDEDDQVTKVSPSSAAAEPRSGPPARPRLAPGARDGVGSGAGLGPGRARRGGTRGRAVHRRARPVPPVGAELRHQGGEPPHPPVGARGHDARCTSCSGPWPSWASSVSSTTPPTAGRGPTTCSPLILAEELGRGRPRLVPMATRRADRHGHPVAAPLRHDRAEGALPRPGPGRARWWPPSPSPSPTPAPTWPACAPGPCATATSGSSTARSSTSPTALQADWLCLLARTSDEGGYRGMSQIVVPTDTARVRGGRKLDKLGMRASDTAELRLRRRAGAGGQHHRRDRPRLPAADGPVPETSA